MRNSHSLRGGFSLIEVLFSIVILGTMLTAIPTLLGGLKNIEREVLLKDITVLSASKLQQIVTYRWDEEGRDENVTYSRILDINSTFSGDSIDLSREENRTCRNSGLYNREFFANYTKYATTYDSLGKDSGENNYLDYDDIDDWNGVDYNISTTGELSTAIDIDIFYVDDSIKFYSTEANYTISKTPLNRESNIKYINLKVSLERNRFEGSGVEEFELSVLTTNIGEMEFKKRELE